MKTKSIFTGAATALITPTTKYGVDYKKCGLLINRQIEAAINALVICGTTGESSTLTDDERREVMRFAVEHTAGRVPVICGTGCNNIQTAIKQTEYASSIGADAVLVVTPYYNKATQRGLVESYFAIADASTVPVILYNVPSRTGVSIEPETYLKLAQHPRIVAVKEACGNISRVADTLSLVSDMLDIYSGDDDQIVPILSLGGKGVISVLSNVVPEVVIDMCDSFFAGNIQRASQLQLEYLPLIRALFSEVNPIPVKAAMAKLGYCEDYLRLPLTPMEDGAREKLFVCMRKLGIIA